MDITQELTFFSLQDTQDLKDDEPSKVSSPTDDSLVINLTTL